MRCLGLFFCVGSTLLMIYVAKANANIFHVPNIPENQTDTLERWIRLDKGLKKYTHTIIEHLMPKIIDTTRTLNISHQCLEEGMHIMSGLQNLEKWAFSFVDASAKAVDGLLSGNVNFPGVYDQCMNTVVPNTRKKGQTLFRGRYCTIVARPPLPRKTKKYMTHEKLEVLQNFSGTGVVTFLSGNAANTYYVPYHIGICVPSGCTEDDLSQLFPLATEKTLFTFAVENCEDMEEKVEFSGIQIFTIFLTCFFGTLVLVATWIEVKNEGNPPPESTGCRMLLCFSAKTNLRRFISTKTQAENLRCLHGFRFLSIVWVVACHSYLYPGWFMKSYTFLFDAEYSAQHPLLQGIVNGSESVDSFIFMAGMLVCYLSLKLLKDEKKKFDIRLFIFHRLWRIIPVYYFIILFATLAPLMGSGPLFRETMTEFFTPCTEYYWRNMLFINNFFKLDDMCMNHTWFISCEFQLYLSSLLVILPLVRSEVIGVTINILIIVASVVYTGLVSYLLEPPPAIIMTYLDPEFRSLGLMYTYGNALSRAGPYFIGVFTGYLIYKFPSIKIPRKMLIIGWCLAILSSGTTIFITGAWFRIRPPTPLEKWMYGTFYKIAYTAGIAWLVFCCVTGNGGILTDILAWRAWVPLSKLTYLIYLIQPFFQVLYIANMRAPQEVMPLYIVVQFFGYLCISTLLALVLNFLLEAPFVQLEKIICESRIKEAEKENHKDEVRNEVISDIGTLSTVADGFDGSMDSSSEKGVSNLSFDNNI